MSAIEEEQSSKHDDFFDDAPAKTMMNGHVSPEKEPAAAAAESTEMTNGEAAGQEDAPATQSQEADAEAPTESEKPEAEGGEATADVQETNVGVDTAHENGDVESEPAAVEGKEPEMSEAAASGTDQASEEPHQADQQTIADGEAEKPGTPASEVTATTEATESGPGENAVTPLPEVDGHAEQEPVPLASRQSQYEEDFSDSGSNVTSARQTPAETKPESQAAAEEKTLDKSKDSSSSSSNSSKASTPVPPTQEETDLPADPKAEVSPGQDASGGAEGEDGERTDSRAEAGAVIPVPPLQTDTKPADADGRSSSPGGDEQADPEAYRGEDRTEMIAPEGSEDCRGQGQWKSAEQQAIATAMMASKSEREITEEAVKERDNLRQDHDTLKTQILALEAEVDKKNEQILVDKEILSRKDKELAELQKELEYSNSANASNEADESRIKDLQERLAVLARENEEKDKRVFRLEEDLKDAQTKLRETERRLLQAESRAGAEAPKSKTCVIM